MGLAGDEGGAGLGLHGAAGAVPGALGENPHQMPAGHQLLGPVDGGHIPLAPVHREHPQGGKEKPEGLVVKPLRLAHEMELPPGGKGVGQHHRVLEEAVVAHHQGAALGGDVLPPLDADVVQDGEEHPGHPPGKGIKSFHREVRPLM